SPYLLSGFAMPLPPSSRPRSGRWLRSRRSPACPCTPASCFSVLISQLHSAPPPISGFVHDEPPHWPFPSCSSSITSPTEPALLQGYAGWSRRSSQAVRRAAPLLRWARAADTHDGTARRPLAPRPGESVHPPPTRACRPHLPASWGRPARASFVDAVTAA